MRLHSDERAADSAHTLNTLTYTRGQETISLHTPFLATIRRESGKSSDTDGYMQPAASGAPPQDVAYQPDVDIPEPEEGQTIRLPDVTGPEGEMTSSDSINSTFTYQGTITQQGPVDPGDFGTTKGTIRLSHLSLTPGNSTY